MPTTRPATEEDLPSILALQREAHRGSVSARVAAEDGFVSWQHDLPTLLRLNEPIAHTVAVHEDGSLLGYALSMSPDHRYELPSATKLFELIETLTWNTAPLSEQAYTVMGQVCVASAWRGKGLFRAMYREWFRAQSTSFTVAVTEISEANVRSLSAHAAIGWMPIGTNLEGGQKWVVVARDVC